MKRKSWKEENFMDSWKEESNIIHYVGRTITKDTRGTGLNLFRYPNCIQNDAKWCCKFWTRKETEEIKVRKWLNCLSRDGKTVMYFAALGGKRTVGRCRPTRIPHWRPSSKLIYGLQEEEREPSRAPRQACETNMITQMEVACRVNLPRQKYIK